MMPPGIEPQSPGPLANTLPTSSMTQFTKQFAITFLFHIYSLNYPSLSFVFSKCNENAQMLMYEGQSKSNAFFLGTQKYLPTEEHESNIKTKLVLCGSRPYFSTFLLIAMFHLQMRVCIPAL